MQIYSVNGINPVFKARTEHNNEYDKTNAGKVFGIGVGVGCIAQELITKGGFSKLAEEFHKELAESVSKEASKATGNKTEIKKLTTPLLKRMANTNFIASVAILSTCCIAIGAVFDEIVNEQRRERADGRNY